MAEDDDMVLQSDGSLLHEPPNELLRIDAIYAFVSVDDDGNEGLCGATMPDGMWMPLIGADEKRLIALMPIAEELAHRSRREIKLIKLTTREELRTIRPLN